MIDQRPVSTNRRSTPITYTGIAPPIRALFAKVSGLPAGWFSANSDGACPTCKGLGVIYTDLAFMDGQETVCETCQGRRLFRMCSAMRSTVYPLQTLTTSPFADAIARLSDTTIRTRLQHLEQVGLGYLRLGQPLMTLSGGESQRVKIAKELRGTSEPTRYVLDEPTTGLHLRDIATLLHVLNQLVDQRHTVVVIEHNLDVIRHADWAIDLGPGPGRHGGQILYQGPVAQTTGTVTADALRSTSGPKLQRRGFG